MVPSPLVGEGQGEGWPQSTEAEDSPDWITANGCVADLSDRGYEPKAVTPSLSLPVPRKGGGNVVALLCPFLPKRTRVRLQECACRIACAGTTAESRCSTSPFAGTKGDWNQQWSAPEYAGASSQEAEDISNHRCRKCGRAQTSKQTSRIRMPAPPAPSRSRA